MGKALWPEVDLWSKQRDVVHSVTEATETVVVAGNELGKDFVAGWVALLFFLRPQMFFDQAYVLDVERQRRPGVNPHTRRVVTHSVAEHHLKVLWGEIGRFYTTSRLPLDHSQGGPLTINYQEIRLHSERESKNPYNYLVGRVSAKDEGLAGHHAAYTLFIGDEASGLDDAAWKAAQGWAKRFLLFGNPNPCNNFFRRAVRDGDLRVEAA